MVGGEDCLNEVSSAAAPNAALRPKEISGSGVAFFLDTFSWLRKKKYLASRARATYNPTILKTVILNAQNYTFKENRYDHHLPRR